MGADHSSTPLFTAMAELASERVGGRAIATNDDFFASKANLVKAEPAIFVAGKYTSRGKWMDGWESRRRRTPGHDWCVVQLGMRGSVHGVNVDTHFFTGNYPSHCSIDAFDGGARPVAPARLPKVEWVEILPKAALRGDDDNFLAITDRRPWTHLRLNIYPDGGVARLRVYGEVAIDWTRVARAGRSIDLASIANGGLVIGASDMHYGARDNMIMPGRASSMADGWETKRRRGPGYDWAIVRLGTSGVITEIEIDTNHFKGNFPESASIDGSLAPDASLDELTSSATWTVMLVRTPLRPHHRHRFRKELTARWPFSHVRLNIYPDGGVSRLRIHGTVATP